MLQVYHDEMDEEIEKAKKKIRAVETRILFIRNMFIEKVIRYSLSCSHNNLSQPYGDVYLQFNMSKDTHCICCKLKLSEVEYHCTFGQETLMLCSECTARCINIYRSISRAKQLLLISILLDSHLNSDLCKYILSLWANAICQTPSYVTRIENN